MSYCTEYPYEDVLDWVRISNAPVAKINAVPMGVMAKKGEEIKVFESVLAASAWFGLPPSTFSSRLDHRAIIDGWEVGRIQ